MKFHLNYIPKKPEFTIDHQSKILLVGSCFAENIGALLNDHKFSVMTNPNGILFNPVSIYNCLNSALTETNLDEKLVLEREGVFLSYFHHSSVSGKTKKGLINKVQVISKNTIDFIKTTDILIITFGTAFIYEHKHSGQIVANCHKQSASSFDKKMLEVGQVTEMYSKLIEGLLKINPTLKIIFTVSPVKYLKDGVEENNLSKSVLLLGVNAVVSKFQNCFYFPAFELVNDDLRDYRFYKEDMAHPNHLAVDYIWQKFSDCFFGPDTSKLNTEINKLQLALNHRQMQENGPENAKFLDFIDKQKGVIKKLNPKIEF
jgi:hypothetical protein